MRVLVVDDEKVLADSTVLVFRKCGHEAEAVYSAEEALAAIQHFQPNLLLADMKMSGTESSWRSDSATTCQIARPC